MLAIRCFMGQRISAHRNRLPDDGGYQRRPDALAWNNALSFPLRLFLAGTVKQKDGTSRGASRILSRASGAHYSGRICALVNNALVELPQV
jgi:hypothetical protein